MSSPFNGPRTNLWWVLALAAIYNLCHVQVSCWAWTTTNLAVVSRTRKTALFMQRPNIFTTSLTTANVDDDNDSSVVNPLPDTTTNSRRSWLLRSASLATAALTTSLIPPTTHNIAWAAESTSANAKITDRIFLDIKGLNGAGDTTTKRLVIGLFGNEAPRSTNMLKQLCRGGLPAPCKPKQEKTLQKEQLEANKVYNSCIESQEKGVNYEYSQIWRVIPGERIDVGAVSGKFIAREFPTWQEDTPSPLRHDSPGVVSVRRGNDSGFGFTIYPGSSSTAAAAGEAAQYLDDEQIVVGRVMEESMELLAQLNAVPVITTSKVSYMGLTGGANNKSAPSRACSYGGAMYCNENKPLIKLSITGTGVL